MSRWMSRLIPLILTGAVSVFAQYGGGGIGMPGGIRIPMGGSSGVCQGGQYPVNGQCPGGQYPGGQYPGSQNPGGRQTLYGTLRQINYGNLAIETDDSRILQMQIAPNARYYTNF